ncbi:MAG: hypothetical protein ABIJ09_16775 [Pseudomonadota bacterium]
MHAPRFRSLLPLAFLILFSTTPLRAQDSAPATSDEVSIPADPSSAPATAQPLDEDKSLRLHGGLNLRTDVGVHPIRLDAGAQWKDLDMLLVVDPMVLLDGQMSSDFIAQWRSDLGVALFGGWRLSTIPLLEGAQFQHNLLLGAGAELPRWFGGLLGGQVGLEMSSVLLKHGGGIPAETISFASGRHYIDLVNLALFLRLELGWQP